MKNPCREIDLSVDRSYTLDRVKRTCKDAGDHLLYKDAVYDVKRILNARIRQRHRYSDEIDLDCVVFCIFSNSSSETDHKARKILWTLEYEYTMHNDFMMVGKRFIFCSDTVRLGEGIHDGIYHIHIPYKNLYIGNIS